MSRATSNSDWKDGFLFVGNQLALDFLNTCPVQNGEPSELLPDFSALLRWFQAADQLSSREVARLQRQWGGSASAQSTTQAVRQLRETLRKEIIAWEHSGSVQHSTRDGLNKLMAEHPMRTRLRKNGKSYSTELRSNRVNQTTCLLRWRTVRRHYSRPWIASASGSVPTACCISMTLARKGHDAGAACNYVGIA